MSHKNVDQKKIDTEIINFLAEKCENIINPLIIRQIHREYLERSRQKITFANFYSKIYEYRSQIQNDQEMDSSQKVKILYGLGSRLSDECLEELKKNAKVVQLDELKRITKYISNDESLKLEGSHDASIKAKAEWRNRTGKKTEDEEKGDIIKFVIEKCENVTHPLSFRSLYMDYKKIFGECRGIYFFSDEIRSYLTKVPKMRAMDHNTKVKMLFGLSAEIEEEYLEKLASMATITTDDKKRITKYIANDGSLSLEGKHDPYSKVRLSLDMKQGRITVDEERKKRGRPPGGKSSMNNQMKKRKTQEENDYQFLIDNMENQTPEADVQTNLRVKLEPFDGPLNMDLTRGAVINDGDNFVEELPADGLPALSNNNTNHERVLISVKTEVPDIPSPRSNRGNESVISVGSGVLDRDRDHISLHAVLEAFYILIDNLELPILTELQKKIEQKMKENDKLIQNDEIRLLLKLCLAKVNRNWNSSFEDSFSLKHFLTQFKLTVAFMEIQSLNGFQEKLKLELDKLRIDDKMVPLAALHSALQFVYDHIISL